MRLIGLTGGIATGKSTVAAMLEHRGAIVVDADRLAREVVEPGSPGIERIIDEFGAGMVGPDGGLDRPALATLVFADPERRRALEAITHPLIIELMTQRVAAALGTAAPLVVADVPLLFESAAAPFPVDGVLLVDSPEDVQVRRLIRRDGLDVDRARRRLNAQMPMSEKRHLASWVIDNGGDPEVTAAQVDSWWSEHVAPDQS